MSRSCIKNSMFPFNGMFPINLNSYLAKISGWAFQWKNKFYRDIRKQAQETQKLKNTIILTYFLSRVLLSKESRKKIINLQNLIKTKSHFTPSRYWDRNLDHQIDTLNNLDLEGMDICSKKNLSNLSKLINDWIIIIKPADKRVQ